MCSAVARVCMQLWDIKWKNKIGNLGIKTWLLGRYMDDARAFLPPLRHGWRGTEAGLCYTQEWEKEDAELSPTEVTKRALATTMKGVMCK